MTSSTPQPKAASVRAVALAGVDGHMLEIRAQLHDADHSIEHPWHADQTHEARDRVRAAVRNSALTWPTAPVTVTLTPPAGLSAVVGGDLALACAVLAAAGLVPTSRLGQTVLLGDLALNGQLRPVRGVLPALLAARQAGLRHAIVPRALLAEAALVPGLQVLGAEHLFEVVAWLRDEHHRLPTPSKPATTTDPQQLPDLAEVRGHSDAVRALEVAAAGGHHLLLWGSAGSGTTVLARCLPGLLPALTHQQALEVTAIHSLAGTLTPEAPLITRPPLVSPHHSTSTPALLGGGTGVAKPGAISRAHHGVLHLDRAGEFDPSRLESLRTALEDGEIRLARRDSVARYPAQFLLVLTNAACPCGRSDQECLCSPHTQRRYLARLSGPLLDRIDLRVRLEPTPPSAGPAADSTAMVRERVEQARHRAAARWATHGWRTNAEVPAETLRGEFGLPHQVTAELDRVLTSGAITQRGADHTLRVAWTISDLDQTDHPQAQQVAEALALRGINPTDPADH